MNTWIAARDRRDENLPPYISTEKAQALLGDCTRFFLYTLLGQKRFRAVKVGSRLLIDTTSLLEYLGGLPQADISPPGRPGRPGRQRKVAEGATP